jgi:hypothetical protein
MNIRRIYAIFCSPFLLQLPSAGDIGAGGYMYFKIDIGFGWLWGQVKPEAAGVGHEPDSAGAK